MIFFRSEKENNKSLDGKSIGLCNIYDVEYKVFQNHKSIQSREM